MSALEPEPPRKTVFVTGSNGYIGFAVCRAFLRAGYRVYGLVRRPAAAVDLVRAEVTPVVGGFDTPEASQAVRDHLAGLGVTTFDVIASCTEKIPGYKEHYEQAMGLVQLLAAASNAGGVRPLVLWTSGCKDYGTTRLHGDPALAPHVETTPIEASRMHPLLVERTVQCQRIFEHGDQFDAVLLRPTSVYGYTGSYYGTIFDWAEAQAKKVDKTQTEKPVLTIPEDPNSIMHAMHVDDCAEAYVGLAEHEDRAGAIAGQVFNISGWRYETLEEVGEAVAREYGFTGGVTFIPQEQAPADYTPGLHVVFGFPQWVGSDKIRRVLGGWRDRRPLFSHDLHTYRLSYESARAEGADNIAKVQERMTSVLS